MDQVYFVYKPQAGASGSRFTSPTCLYRYGRFCYTGPVELATGVPSMEHLPSVMRYLQSIQGTIPYFTEFDAIPKHSPHSKSLATLNEALDFIKEELGSVEEVLAEYLETETWIAEEDVNLYFEFESRASYTLNNAEVVFAKTFTGDIMLTVIWYRSTFYVTLSPSSSGEQALVDTMFPQIYGKRRGLQLRAYDHPVFSKLSLWEASEQVPDPAFGRAPGQTAAAGDGRRATGTEDLAGEGYMQVYCVMKPKHLDSGSTRRDALFRFGNWCYGGEVDFGVEGLHLGDVPDVLPTLQKQQGNLAYLCEISKFPSDSPNAAVLAAYKASLEFLTAEMLSVEEELEKLSQLGLTGWLNEDWSSSFFELAFEVPPEMEHVEVIASKQYTSVGIVLHCVWFGGSLYCVLADTKDDQPLLDVAFPDVTARCRGVQVKQYAEAEYATRKDLPMPKRLSVWEGRRKGVPGVGWGTVAAVKEDAFRAQVGHGSVGDEIRAAARKRAAAEAAEAAAATAAASPAKAQAEAGAEGKASEDAPAPAPSPAPAAEESKVAEVPEPDAEGKDSEPTPSAAAGGGGAGSALSPGRAQGFSLGAAKAPHHLPAMGGSSRLRSLGASGKGGSAAPWGADGRPVLGGASSKK